MPIDTSIYGQLQPAKFESPMNALAQVMQVKGAQSQNKLAQLALGQKEREIADDQAVRDVYAKFGAGAEALPELAKVSPTAYHSAAKAQAEIAKQNREAEKAQLEMAGKRAEMVGQALSPVLQNPALYPQALAYLREQIPGGGKDMPDQFDPAAVQAAVQRAMSVKDQVAQVWKAKEFDLDVQKFGETKRHNRQAEGISAGNLAVSRANLGVAQERLNLDKSKTGKVANMSATMQKELFEADDTVQSSRNVIGLLQTAQKLNDKAYSGLGATTRAAIWGQIPGVNAESANATIDLDNIMTGQALESLKAVFGGMPTEGERKILMDMQASADKTPAQRKSIMDRAIKAAENRLKFNASKAQSLRDGTYTTTAPTASEGNGSGLTAEEQRELAELRKRLGR